MERGSRKDGEKTADAVIADRRGQIRRLAVGPVSDQRVVSPVQMDPDPVRSPGIEAAAVKGGDGRLPARGGRPETKVSDLPPAATADARPLYRRARVRPDRRIEAGPGACAEGKARSVRQHKQALTGSGPRPIFLGCK